MCLTVKIIQAINYCKKYSIYIHNFAIDSNFILKMETCFLNSKQNTVNKLYFFNKVHMKFLVSFSVKTIKLIRDVDNHNLDMVVCF